MVEEPLGPRPRVGRHRAHGTRGGEDVGEAGALLAQLQLELAIAEKSPRGEERCVCV